MFRKWRIQFVIMKILDIASKKTKSNYVRENTDKIVKKKKKKKSSKLTHLVDLEVAMRTCILIILGRERRRLLMK